MARPVLCVFVKPPIPGEAKTRLIPTLGATGAARLAQAFLVDTLSVAGRVGWPRLVVAVAGPVEGVVGPGLRGGVDPFAPRRHEVPPQQPPAQRQIGPGIAALQFGFVRR